MASRPKLFPFYLSEREAWRLIKEHPDHAAELEKRQRYANIVNHQLTVQLHVNGTAEMNGWAATDNGYVQQAGSYWRKTIQLSNQQIAEYIEEEFRRRAESELLAEDQAAYELRLKERIVRLKEQMKL
jgi:hypothetical protein